MLKFPHCENVAFTKCIPKSVRVIFRYFLGNFRTFLSLRFYVKLILVLKLQFRENNFKHAVQIVFTRNVLGKFPSQFFCVINFVFID